MTKRESRGVIAFMLHLRESPESGPLAEAVSRAAQAGFLPLVAQEDPESLIEPHLSAIRLLVAIGGDGTLLYGARLVGLAGIPVLGVNRGHLGFLASVELPDLPTAISAFVEGRCEIQRRSALRAAVSLERGARPEAKLDVAVNEVVVKTDTFNLVRIRVRAGAELMGDFDADGLIVATSIGSSAYSLSAGGPPLNPGVPALVVTALNPHALLSRSLVIPDTMDVAVELLRGRAVVAADGRPWAAMGEGAELVVSRGPQLEFCEPPGTPDFFARLRSKTGFGRVLKLPHDAPWPPSEDVDPNLHTGPRI